MATSGSKMLKCWATEEELEKSYKVSEVRLFISEFANISHKLPDQLRLNSEWIE